MFQKDPQALLLSQLSSTQPSEVKADDHEVVNIIAIISPADGKSSRVESLLSEAITLAQSHEPGTLQLHLHKEIPFGPSNSEASTSEPRYVLVGKFANMNAVVEHQQSEPSRKFLEAVEKEGLYEKPLAFYSVDAVAGFDKKNRS